jgi:hypothetical protein
MPASDDLLRALWQAIERAGDLERELQRTAESLAGWRDVAEAAVRALDREIARRREADAGARTIRVGDGEPC